MYVKGKGESKDSIKVLLSPFLLLVLNLGHSPLYRHFYKCLYIEMLKKNLFINYWHIANPILSGRRLIKSLQPLNILVKNLPRYSHADFPCIFTVLIIL